MLAEADMRIILRDRRLYHGIDLDGGNCGNFFIAGDTVKFRGGQTAEINVPVSSRSTQKAGLRTLLNRAMATFPHGPFGNPIKKKKELGQVLCGLGYYIGFVSILLFMALLYVSGDSTSLLIVTGSGAISLVLLILGYVFRRKR